MRAGLFVGLCIAVALIGVLCGLYLFGVIDLVLVSIGSGVLLVLCALAFLALEWGRLRARRALRSSAKRHAFEARYGPLPEYPPTIDEAVRAQVRHSMLRSPEEEGREEEERRVRLPVPSAPRIPGKGLDALTPETSSVTADAVAPLDSPRASQSAAPVRVVMNADEVVQPLVEDVVTPVSPEAQRLVSRPSRSSSALPIPPLVPTPMVGGVAPSDSRGEMRVFPASTGKARKKKPIPQPLPPKKRTVGDMYRPVAASVSTQVTEGVGDA